MKRSLFALLVLPLLLASCGMNSSDDTQQVAQERLLKEGTAQVGMPNIKNFREKKLLKDILELRDQSNLVTYTYLYNEFSGTFTFLGETVGYGLPYATQFTNPEKIADWGQGGYAILPQADPNGLFSPNSAEGTWVLMKDPITKDVKPVYVEPRIMVFPFVLKLSDDGHIIR